MKIKVFYWNERIIGRRHDLIPRFFNRKLWYFKHGNAGDIFNIDLFRYLYNCEIVCTDSSPKVLSIGSILHRSLKNDVILGAGVKDPSLIDKFSVPKNIHVIGLRGPLSVDILRNKGFDLSLLNFLGDPGLLIDKIYPDYFSKENEANKIIFIPHYRERSKYLYKKIKGIEVVDIDCQPKELVKKIRESKFVISSSLHGLIFAHALNRPTAMLYPTSGENLFKYRDYYASIGKDLPVNIEEVTLKNISKITDTPISVDKKSIEEGFPDIKRLAQFSVLK